MADGQFIVGDGSGGGGGVGISGYSGGAGGGGNDTLTGSGYNDVIFGDGSGGGGGVALFGVGGGGAGGGGADAIFGGAGDDILFGDGFNGAPGHLHGWDPSSISYAGNGGLGGGGGGGGAMGGYTPGAGGYGAGNGGQSSAGTSSTLALKDGTAYTQAVGRPIYNATYGGGGGGFGDAGDGGGNYLNAVTGAHGTVTYQTKGEAGFSGGTSTYSMTDSGGAIHDSLLAQVTAGNIYNSTAGTLNGYGAGNDVLDGGAGSDHYFGMGGADTFIISAQDNAASDTDTVWDFSRTQGDKLQLEDINGQLFSTGQLESLLSSASVGSDTTFTMSNGSTIIIKNVADLTAADFFVACFLPGTRFDTSEGLKAVEELVIGDLLKTIDGFRPLKWLARRDVLWDMSIPRRAAPVLITQGALGNGLPQRDLFVSPGHAFLIGDLLVNAELLVNGTTIVQLLNYNRDFSYYNIEFDEHTIIYAEGTPVESYLEVGDNRNTYSNAAEFRALYPHHRPVAAMDKGRVTLKRQLPQSIAEHPPFSMVPLKNTRCAL